MVRALRSLREVLAGAKGDELDPELFRHGLRRVIEHPADKAQAVVVGAAAGILYGEGLLSEEALIRVVAGYLGGAVRDPRRTCGILRGLLATAREIAWQVNEVIRAIDAEFRSWDEKTFLEALPELRLAFTDLTPREVARVADHVAGVHGEKTLGELVRHGPGRRRGPLRPGGDAPGARVAAGRWLGIRVSRRVHPGGFSDGGDEPRRSPGQREEKSLRADGLESG